MISYRSWQCDWLVNEKGLSVKFIWWKNHLTPCIPWLTVVGNLVGNFIVKSGLRSCTGSASKTHPLQLICKGKCISSMKFIGFSVRQNSLSWRVDDRIQLKMNVVQTSSRWQYWRWKMNGFSPYIDLYEYIFWLHIVRSDLIGQKMNKQFSFVNC